MSAAVNLLNRWFLVDSNGQLVVSKGQAPDIQFTRKPANPLPCFRFEPSTDSQRSSQVIVDHLAFSVPLANFRHLERAGSAATKRYGWPRVTQPPRPSDYQDDEHGYNKALKNFNQDAWDTLFIRMQSWVQQVMGLQLSGPRDKGLHGYQNSHRLLDRSGRVELGFVGIGGNNNTVYFQISGQGCRHVFDQISPFSLSWWLSEVLDVTRLSRIDLAYDDFTGNFDCDYAQKAYRDNAFQGMRGGPLPKMQACPEYLGDKLVGNIVKVGSRKSDTYWRIYDKAAEQGLKDKVWYRSEVELKRVDVDALSNPAKAFAGLNRFSASVNIEHGFAVRRTVARAALDMAGRIRWARQQCGRTLSDILETFGGDIYTAFGCLCDERGGKFAIPDTQAALLNLHLKEGLKHDI